MRPSVSSASWAANSPTTLLVDSVDACVAGRGCRRRCSMQPRQGSIGPGGAAVRDHFGPVCPCGTALHPWVVPIAGLSRCRRRDSNPRHADYDWRVAAHFGGNSRKLTLVGGNESGHFCRVGNMVRHTIGSWRPHLSKTTSTRARLARFVAQTTTGRVRRRPCRPVSIRSRGVIDQPASSSAARNRRGSAGRPRQMSRAISRMAQATRPSPSGSSPSSSGRGAPRTSEVQDLGTPWHPSILLAARNRRIARTGDLVPDRRRDMGKSRPTLDLGSSWYVAPRVARHTREAAPKNTFVGSCVLESADPHR
jgi:hypothetical protein